MNLIANVQGLRKTFNRSNVLNNISFSLHLHETLLITGRNGSGKSTLSKILADLLSPTSGTMIVLPGCDSEERRLHLGFVAPYLQLFEEFTPLEHLELAWRLRGYSSRPSVGTILDEVGLGAVKKKTVRTLSSGMKQRLKYAVALDHRPRLLILDEPMANLDVEGVTMVHKVMSDQTSVGALVVATNNPEEVSKRDHQVDLNEQ